MAQHKARPMSEPSYQHGDPYAHARRGEFFGGGRYSRDGDQDEQHLKLLSIFYYILAGMNAVAGLIWVLYLVLVLFMFASAQNSTNGGPPPEAGLVCFGFILVALLAQW